MAISKHQLPSLYLLHKGSVTKSSQAVALAIIYYICSTLCTGSNVSFLKLSYYTQWRLIKYQESQTPTILLATRYSDVIMSAMASEITSLTIVYATVYSGADQRKHQSSASLAFVREIHRGPVKSPPIWPVTRKLFPFDDVIMTDLWRSIVDPLKMNMGAISSVMYVDILGTFFVWDI